MLFLLSYECMFSAVCPLLKLYVFYPVEHVLLYFVFICSAYINAHYCVQFSYSHPQSSQTLSTLHSPPNSMWNPCGFPALYRDSTGIPGNLEEGSFGRKSHPNLTWSGPGVDMEQSTIYREYSTFHKESRYLDWTRNGGVQVQSLLVALHHRMWNFYFGNISWTRPDIAILIIQSGFYNHSLCFSFLSRDRENLLPCIVNVYKLYLYWKLKKWSVTCDMWHMSQCFVTMLWKDGT